MHAQAEFVNEIIAWLLSQYPKTTTNPNYRVSTHTHT